ARPPVPTGATVRLPSENPPRTSTSFTVPAGRARRCTRLPLRSYDSSAPRMSVPNSSEADGSAELIHTAASPAASPSDSTGVVSVTGAAVTTLVSVRPSARPVGPKAPAARAATTATSVALFQVRCRHEPGALPHHDEARVPQGGGEAHPEDGVGVVEPDAFRAVHGCDRIIKPGEGPEVAGQLSGSAAPGTFGPRGNLSA